LGKTNYSSTNNDCS